ncbi:MAG: GDP-mannose 4,6-dehydratase, partial [Oligoflexia bacterium]|nr:GDP-mannose 4,6-dehydratase [Oligoflexia bacterium]
FASTSEVYGDPLVHPQTEEYWGNVNPVGLRSCYDESKRYAEALTMAYRRKFSLRTGITRIFNTYGPRMRLDDGRVVPNFILQALKGTDLTIYGDGQQTRSFCYVDDLNEGLVRLMEQDIEMPVNLGNPSEQTIMEFATRVIGISGSSSRIVFMPPVPDDPRKRKPDIGRARTLLGWEPRVDLDCGLRKTLEYFKSKA